MQKHTLNALKPIGIAVAMTALFWWPLYCGAGFIGGDLYPYFFPQKAFYADALKAGHFPLWNDLSGFGYPVLGESQTGAAYPFHFVFYYLFDLNTAYNIEHLLHYLICFIGTWLLARRMGLTVAGAYLSAVVFTYGWFPPRACLEWAILTGAWMPVALWCVESFLQTGMWRYAIGLSVALGLQLLAGHFHLAFITLLLILTFPTVRLFWNRHQNDDQTVHGHRPCRTRTATGLILAVVAAAGLASVQLIPTWELKQRSTRVILGSEYDPAYGHMPPLYVSQVVAPWRWYNLLEVGEEHLIRDLAEFAAPWHWFGPRVDSEKPNQLYDLDRALQQARFGAMSVGTNKVEAHFYCGLVPVCLAFSLVIVWLRLSILRTPVRPADSILLRPIGFWLFASLFAVLYATGALMPIGRQIPGFSFFRGPGRYGIVPTLAIALFAGQMLGQILPKLSSRFARSVFLAIVFLSTGSDLWLVSRMVRYTVMVTPPRINFRNDSVVRQKLQQETQIPRLLSPGPNVGNLLGVSCVPWYLGIAPAEYVDPQFAMPPQPKPLENRKPTPGTVELVEWLSRSGVTHILNFEPLEESSWQAELVWSGFDPLLNRVWAREEPLFLYRFRLNRNSESNATFPGRAYTSEGNLSATVDWKNREPNSRRVELPEHLTGNNRLILTELAYPGWTVRQGTKSLEATNEGLFRAVELGNSHDPIEWKYRPNSVYWGAVLSVATILILAGIAHVRFWHPALVKRWIDRLFRNC